MKRRRRRKVPILFGADGFFCLLFCWFSSHRGLVNARWKKIWKNTVANMWNVQKDMHIENHPAWPAQTITSNARRTKFQTEIKSFPFFFCLAVRLKQIKISDASANSSSSSSRIKRYEWNVWLFTLFNRMELAGCGSGNRFWPNSHLAISFLYHSYVHFIAQWMRRLGIIALSRTHTHTHFSLVTCPKTFAFSFHADIYWLKRNHDYERQQKRLNFRQILKKTLWVGEQKKKNMTPWKAPFSYRT